jgi:DNA-directed RNA polymerase subunit RPC12/RpoP
MIHVQCQHCGAKLRVPESHAGKEGRCPRCRNKLVVPQAAQRPATEELHLIPAVAAPSQGDALPDRPLQTRAPEGPDEARRREEELLESARSQSPPEHTGQRRLPWPIDILLYPANMAGLTVLAVIIGVPLLLSVFGLLMLAVPFLGLLFLGGGILIHLYAAWYFTECVYDSGMGGTRAPQALDVSDMGEMLSRVVYVLLVGVPFLLPVIVYFLIVRRADAIFWALLAWAVVFFPMGLLAMIIHDSISALNPLLLLGSIFRVFLPHVGFVLLLGVLVVGWVCLRLLLPVPAIVGFAAGKYVMLVLAHLLGRFYWRYHDRLDWGI